MVKVVALLLTMLSTHTFFEICAHAAENYPNKPIRFIVPYPPGGGNDFVARVIAPRLSENIRQQVVIDNRGGAHGIIATELTAKAPPDGYTILLGGTGHAINPIFYRNLPYDNEKDFAPITLAAVAPNVLVVHPSVAAKSVKELIALAKANPKQLNFASVGAGGNTHLAAELFKLRSNVDIVHVSYRGTGPATTALLSGEVQMMFSTLPPALAQIRTGKLRAIGLTSPKRSAAMPEVPTIAESGLPGYEALGWWGILGPGKTPERVVAILNAELVKVLSSDDAKANLFKEGIEAAGSTAQQYGAYIMLERQKWAKVVTAANIKLE
ncbi:MAG TPA: tripartite tricarboxylate transporter substrate binding protein [Burkholderiales bacterium]|nr:tripartite tricarboxylate transporter substrate binding protein [Burkholderiales bacterium]